MAAAPPKTLFRIAAPVAVALGMPVAEMVPLAPVLVGIPALALGAGVDLAMTEMVVGLSSGAEPEVKVAVGKPVPVG